MGKAEITRLRYLLGLKREKEQELAHIQSKIEKCLTLPKGWEMKIDDKKNVHLTIDVPTSGNGVAVVKVSVTSKGVDIQSSPGYPPVAPSNAVRTAIEVFETLRSEDA